MLTHPFLTGRCGERDHNLIELLKKSLGSGKIEKHSKNPVVNISIVKFSDIVNIVIPFCWAYASTVLTHQEKYPLIGGVANKKLEFTVPAGLELKNCKPYGEKLHLTPDGLVHTCAADARILKSKK